MTLADFLDSHGRHQADAETLYQQGRYANADHLFGLAAECGLKRLMEAFGMQLSGGKPPKRDLKHINALWTRYESYRSGAPQGASYLLPSSNPFTNWSVDQRYEHRRGFTPPIVDPHRACANVIASLVRRAQLGGLL